MSKKNTIFNLCDDLYRYIQKYTDINNLINSTNLFNYDRRALLYIKLNSHFSMRYYTDIIFIEKIQQLIKYF